MNAIGIVLLLLIPVGLFLWSRLNEIFCVSVRDGRVLLVRGRIPPGVMHAIADVIRRSGAARGTIRAVAGEHHARLEMSGLDEATAQRLRNVFGHHPIHKLRGARLPETRNLGQILGIAWLAWLFTDRSS